MTAPDPLLELGGRALHALRRAGRSTPWEKLARETQMVWRAQMQELINALGSGGYTISPKSQTFTVPLRKAPTLRKAAE